MTVHILNELSDYWDTSKDTPWHDFTDLMPRNRFQELHMRVRLVGMDASGTYAKVSSAQLVFVIIFR